MKMTIRHINVRSTDSVDSLVEDRILALQPRLEVEEARVRLERRHDLSPPFRVSIHIVTPGPDLQAEDQDHTLVAAIAKVMDALETKIAVREKKKTRRVRGNLQAPAASRELGGKHPMLRAR